MKMNFIGLKSLSGSAKELDWKSDYSPISFLMIYLGYLSISFRNNYQILIINMYISIRETINFIIDKVNIQINIRQYNHINYKLII